MTYTDELGKVSPPSSASQPPSQYILTPLLHPNGWKLEVRDKEETLFHKVTRKLTEPISYTLHSYKPIKAPPMKIKSTSINGVPRFSLYKGHLEQLSILLTLPSSTILVRESSRKVIARFIPLTPEIVHLCTPTTSVGRLRFKDKPAPLHYQIECHLDSDSTWLLASILYTITRMETAATPSISAEEIPTEMDDSAEND